jgi:hypothetical protein
VRRGRTKKKTKRQKNQSRNGVNAINKRLKNLLIISGVVVTFLLTGCRQNNPTRDQCRSAIMTSISCRSQGNKVTTARFPNICIKLGTTDDELRVFGFSFFFSMLVFSKSSNKEQQLQKYVMSSVSGTSATEWQGK